MMDRMPAGVKLRPSRVGRRAAAGQARRGLRASRLELDTTCIKIYICLIASVVME
jgi:hypothetical protein